MIAVEAEAVVIRDVPNNSLIVGNPAQVVGHISTSVLRTNHGFCPTFTDQEGCHGTEMEILSGEQA